MGPEGDGTAWWAGWDDWCPYYYGVGDALAYNQAYNDALGATTDCCYGGGA